MITPKIAALYCRISKSDDTRDKSNSIAHQKVLLEKAALQYGFEHTQFFIDDGYSGTVFERPALKRLEDAIRAERVCAVLVKDISRLGRDYLKIGYYLEQLFPLHHVRFIAVSGGIDSNTASTDFLPLYSVMDEWYARDISRKLRVMYQARAVSGAPIGSPMYGFMRSASDPRYWELNPETAPVVQRVFQLALLGYGIGQIADVLERAQIPNPSPYRKPNIQSAHSPYHWATSTVSKILRTREYCGDVVNLKTYSHSYKDKKRRPNSQENMIVLRNVHEAIIERSLWEYIQHKLNRPAKRRKSGKQSLFSGFLRCGNCGSNLHYHFNQANPSIEYYNCSNYVGNRGSCPNTHYIRLDDLTTKVIHSLNRLIRLANQEQFWREIINQKRRK